MIPSSVGQGLTRHLDYGNGSYRDEYFYLDRRLFATSTDVQHGMSLVFDANGRIEDFISFANSNWSQSYTYDDLDRLQTVLSGLGDQGFTHDANGNRLSHTQGAGTSHYAIASSSNRIDTISGSLNRSYSYKTTGQVSQITGPLSLHAEPEWGEGEWSAGLLAPGPGSTQSLFADGFESTTPPVSTYQFSYDRANRLSAITGPGLNASYQIGATGMRVAKTVNGQTTRFVYGLNGQFLGSC